MKKKTKPGAIQQLLSYAGNNKKQLYLSTFLATLGELFGMAPFITVYLLGILSLDFSRLFLCS